MTPLEMEARVGGLLSTMGGEIFSVAVTMFVIVMVGLGVGFLMLKLQGAEE